MPTIVNRSAWKWRNITVASFLQEHEDYRKEVGSVAASGTVFIVNSLGRWQWRKSWRIVFSWERGTIGFLKYILL